MMGNIPFTYVTGDLALEKDLTMKTVGYICLPQLISPECLQHMEVAMLDSREQTVDSILGKLQPHIEKLVDEAESIAGKLRPFVDTISVRIHENSGLDFYQFLHRCNADAILVPSFNMLSPRLLDQRDFILDGRGELTQPPWRDKRILLVSLEQSSLLKLDLDMAFELQEQLVLAPIVKAIEESNGKTDENYVKLRDLMLQKLTVEKIAERLGQSKSTIFRWRKMFEDRLAVDIPGFKIGD
jgi:hypothetical protein